MSWSLKAICQKLGVSYSGNGDLVLRQVCGLNNPLPGSVVFLTNPEELSKIPLLDQIAIIVPPGIKSSKHNLIFSSDPLALHVQLIPYLHPSSPASQTIHPTAVIGENVELGTGVTLDAHVVLYPHVKVGNASIIRAGTVIMEHTTIGENSLLYPNVSIREHCQIGDRVIIHSGTVIGSDGYGYFQREGIHHKIPQIGGVIIEDDVEIGGNCTIDRSRFYNTQIGKGSKLDNQVHIAHNVEIGEYSLLTAQVGIAGSVTAGHHLVMGGQAGIIDQVKVGNEVTLLSRALVTKNTADKAVIGGTPGRPAKKWKTMQALMFRLDTLFARVKRLEAQLKSISSD